MEYTKKGIEIELTECISTMNVPENRKPLTDHNLRWMARNLGIKNNTHDRFERAMFCLKFLIKMIKE